MSFLWYLLPSGLPSLQYIILIFTAASLPFLSAQALFFCKEKKEEDMGTVHFYNKSGRIV